MPFASARQKPLICNSSRAGRCLGLSAFRSRSSAARPCRTPPPTATRARLKIHHTHTDEDITVTFKRNGRYDDSGLARLNRFLRDWRNDEQTKMDPQLFDIVWEVYQEVGAKEPIQIISAYRSPADQLDAAPAQPRRRPVQPAHARQGDRLQHPRRAARPDSCRRPAAAARRRRVLSESGRRSSISTSAACAIGRA